MTEALLPELLKSMKMQEHGSIMQEVHFFAVQEFNRNKRSPVSMHRINGFLTKRIPTYQIPAFIEQLKHCGYIIEVPSHMKPKRKTKDGIEVPATGDFFIPGDVAEIEEL